MLKQWLALLEQASGLKKGIQTLGAELDAKALARYPTLATDEVKALVVHHKWMAAAVHGELDRVSQSLTGRVKELAERYGRTTPELAQQVNDLQARVAGHLAKMLFRREVNEPNARHLTAAQPTELVEFPADWQVVRLGNSIRSSSVAPADGRPITLTSDCATPRSRRTTVRACGRPCGRATF